MSDSCPNCGASAGAAPPVGGLCPTCVARTMAPGLLDLLDEPGGDNATAPLEIAGYTIHELAGGGGMGEVYRAERLRDGLTVAVKVVAARLTRDPEITVRFEHEVSTLAQLDHPNIVRVLDQGVTDDGRHYLVSEYVDGCDLRRLLRAQRLEPDRAFAIFDKVCAAIAHAHERGIVHRDLKPANILVGGDGTVKVVDFGLAKTLADDSHWYGFTRTRDTFGTPYYIAPEVTRGAASADARSDVYALGVLLYELLSGALPMGRFTPLSERVPVGRKVDAIVAGALADDPARRTGSVAELAASVRQLAAHHARRRHRSRFAVVAGGVLAVLAVGGLLGAGLAWRRNRAPEHPVYPPPERATRERPWENGLGMKFVPLPDRPLLVSIYETRVRDFSGFSRAENAVLPEWRTGLANPRAQTRGFKGGREPAEPRTGRPSDWDKPGFPQTPDHPVTGVDLVEARLFCAWLTWQERQQGRLSSTQVYRLPREAEWDEIVGHDDTLWLREDATAQANFAGVEVAEVQPWPAGQPTFARRDPFPRTAPVGSFKPNVLGLFDLFGNVCEWVDTPAPDSVGEGAALLYGLRGGSWATGTPRQAKPDFHIGVRPGRAQTTFGFRVVLDLAVDKSPEPAGGG